MKVQRQEQCNNRSGSGCLRLPRSLRLLRRGLRRRLGNGEPAQERRQEAGPRFLKVASSDSASCRPLKALGRRCHTRHFPERKLRPLTHHTRRVQPEARQAAQVHPVEPMRYLPVPHTVQTARRAGRPFFIVTCSTSLEPVLARHFKQ